ncbi:MAG: methyltransferase domain-containing protein [Candidatus Omnitrophota bacterium]
MTSCSDTSKCFSDAAALYDTRAHIQRALAVELAERVRVRPGSIVADIGTGTGRLIEELQRKYPDARYVGVDSSEGMLARGQGARVRADHARLPFRPGAIDLIVSSSCYHWSPELRTAFAAAVTALRAGGRFEVVLFGHDTLKELFESLGAVSPVLMERLGRMPRLPTLEDVCSALALSGFQSFDFEREVRREAFATLKEVLRWSRETGTNGLGRGMFIGKDVLSRAEEYYQSTFKGQVSFDVIWVQAQT